MSCLLGIYLNSNKRNKQNNNNKIKNIYKNSRTTQMMRDFILYLQGWGHPWTTTAGGINNCWPCMDCPLSHNENQKRFCY